MEEQLSTGVFVREYETHSGQIYGYLLKATGGREAEANDIAQEAFMRAWKSKAEFEGRSSVKSWFFTIAVNLFREKIRRKKLVRYVDEVPESVRETTAVQRMARDEQKLLLKKRIDEELDNLPAEYREVFVLIRSEGYSYAEAAEKLGVTVNTVRMRLHRANDKLAQALKDLKELV